MVRDTAQYRTENYEDFKQLTRKKDLFEDSLELNQSELLIIRFYYVNFSNIQLN